MSTQTILRHPLQADGTLDEVSITKNDLGFLQAGFDQALVIPARHLVGPDVAAPLVAHGALAAPLDVAADHAWLFAARAGYLEFKKSCSDTFSINLN